MMVTTSADMMFGHRIESLSSHEPELFAEAFNYSCWRDAMLDEKKKSTQLFVRDMI